MTLPSPAPAVLVAEDNAISREVIAHQLRLLGCEPHCAENGAEAATAWRGGHNFALLLTDLQMPGLDGFELATLVRREEGEPRLPIVALTANAVSEEAQRCRSVGMDDYLSKPLTLVALRGVLERWLPVGTLPAGESAV